MEYWSNKQSTALEGIFKQRKSLVSVEKRILITEFHRKKLEYEIIGDVTIVESMTLR